LFKIISIYILWY